jgi:hypothetical protein
MPIALIVIGALLVVVAFNNTMGSLAHELEADLPGFFIWMVAIAAVLGLGYVPGMKTPSRWLLGLIVLVVVLTNYKQMLAGFTGFASSGAGATASGQAAADPATQFASSPSGPLPTAGQVAGTAGGAASGAAGAGSADPAGAAQQVAGQVAGQAIGAAQQVAGQATGMIADYLNPSTYVGMFAGFGGLV